MEDASLAFALAITLSLPSEAFQGLSQLHGLPRGNFKLPPATVNIPFPERYFRSASRTQKPLSPQAARGSSRLL